MGLRMILCIYLFIFKKKSIVVLIVSQNIEYVKEWKKDKWGYLW
jgi:pantothenate kinase-related protein Tda10